ncbi:MAG TPA: glycosyltransferase 87 family protein [Syntrophomonadaceae bacterium]|nr:glycosyltransferase 87 family protein [Syntrophomonadaceae bacterium]
MGVLKKNVLGLSLLLVLFAAGFLCVYTLRYSSSNSVSNPTPVQVEKPSPGPTDQPRDRPGQPSTGQHNGPHGDQPMALSPGPVGQGSSTASSGLASPLITYALGFMLIFMGIYLFYRKKRININLGDERFILISLLLLGLMFRISSSTLMGGHPFDIALFKGWAASAAHGLLQVYSYARVDYPPLYMYVLFIVGKAASIPAMNPYYTLLLKLPSMLADIATAYLIYRLARKHLALELSLLLCAFYIFNPAVLINSTLWGQVDSFFTLLLVAAVFLLSEKKIGLSSSLFTAAVLMKPQGIIFLPLLFFELLRQKNLKSFLQAAASAICTALLIILPFAWHQGPLWIFKLYANTLGEYPYASVNAFNFFSLLGANYVPDSSIPFLLTYHNWGMLFIVAVTAFTWFIYAKGKSPALASAAALIQIAGVFTFSASMHERYLFPALALAILSFIYLKDKRLLLLSAGFCTTIYVNTYYVLFATINGSNSVSFNPALILTSLLNVGLFIYLVKVMWDIVVRKRTYEIGCIGEDEQ